MFELDVIAHAIWQAITTFDKNEVALSMTMFAGRYEGIIETIANETGETPEAVIEALEIERQMRGETESLNEIINRGVQRMAPGKKFREVKHIVLTMTWGGRV